MTSKKMVPALPLFVIATSVFFMCVGNCFPMLLVYFPKTFRHLFTPLKESLVSCMLHVKKVIKKPEEPAKIINWFKIKVFFT